MGHDLDSKLLFDDLEAASIPPAKRKAYQLLLALQARDAQLVDRVLTGLAEVDPEESLAFIPTNLLRGAIRGLALAEKPEAVRSFTHFLYQHLREAMDPLLSNEEMLAANPALIERLIEKNERLTDPIQRWVGYQRALELAAPLQSSDLVARAMDGCLAIKDPLLAPHQVRLLTQRIPPCDDLDLRELLSERLAELDLRPLNLSFTNSCTPTWVTNATPMPGESWKPSVTSRKPARTSSNAPACWSLSAKPPTPTARLPNRLGFPTRLPSAFTAGTRARKPGPTSSAPS